MATSITPLYHTFADTIQASHLLFTSIRPSTPSHLVHALPPYLSDVNRTTPVTCITPFCVQIGVVLQRRRLNHFREHPASDLINSVGFLLHLDSDNAVIGAVQGPRGELSATISALLDIKQVCTLTF